MTNFKKFKKKLVILASAIGMMLPCQVLAAQPENIHECIIKASYSDEIPVQMGDKFYIEYQDANNNTDHFLIDASEANKESMRIQMADGTYKITNIAYVGYNSEIPVQGYCVTTDFSVGEDAINDIQLGIGETQANRIKTEYRYTIYVKNTASQEVIQEEVPENSTDVVPDTNIGDQEGVTADQNTDGTEDTTVPPSDTEESVSTTPSDTEETIPSTEKVDVEKYEITPLKLFIQNIPVILITIALIVVLILKHRKDKKLGR